MEPHKDQVLHDFARLVRRRLWLILLLALAVSAGAYLLFISRPLEFKAKTTLMIDANREASSTLPLPAGRVGPADPRAYQVAATSLDVVGKALTWAGQPADIISVTVAAEDSFSVSTESNNKSSILTIEATARSADLAAKLANGLAVAVIGWDRTRTNMALEESVAALEGQVAELASLVASGTAADPVAVADLLTQQRLQLVSLSAFRGHAPASIAVLSPAFPPVKAAGLSATIASLLAFVIGAVVSLAGFMVLEAFDDRFGTPSELSKYTGLPVLAQIGRLRGRRNPLPVEALSHLRAGILYGPHSLAPQVVLITSASSGEGKSRVAVGLAKNLARHGCRVLLVEANLRRPRLREELGIRRQASVDLVSQLRRTHDAVDPVVVSDGQTRMFVVPVLTAQQSEGNLFAQGLPVLIQRWREQYDMILIDGAAVLPFADSLTIASLTDGIALVVDLETTRRQEVADAISLLVRAAGRLIGVVTAGGMEGTELATGASRLRTGSRNKGQADEWTAVSPRRSAADSAVKSEILVTPNQTEAVGRQA